MGGEHLHVDVVKVDLLEALRLLLVEVAGGVVGERATGVTVHAVEYKEYNWFTAATINGEA